MNAQPQPSNFAEMAVELRIAQNEGHVDFAELVHATWIQSLYAGHRAVRLDILAATIGLSPDATERVCAAEHRHAERIAEAHNILKALIPFEAEVRALLARVEPEAERHVWQRLVDFVRRR